MIKIADYTIDIVETGRFGLDGGAMFGVVPKTLWERAYAPSDFKNRIPMAAKALLLRNSDYCILVDTGNSPFMSEKELDIYGISFDPFSIETSLHSLGVSPADVTHVVLTHLHFDHVGGAVIRVGAELLPRFPNARYLVQDEQYLYAQNATVKDKASFIQDMFKPLSNHNVLDLLSGDGEILPGIFVERLYGHTKAMQSVRVSDSVNTLYYPADLMPTGAHVSVPYGMAYDNFPLTTIEEKRRILPRLIEENWLVVFEHDALRQSARVEQGERGPKLSTDELITEYGA